MFDAVLTTLWRAFAVAMRASAGLPDIDATSQGDVYTLVIEVDARVDAKLAKKPKVF